MSNKAGWWWEARVVVGGWQPGREFGARRQVEVEAKDLQAAANELLCWSRSYKGGEKILDKQGQVYFSSQCNGLQFTMHRLYKSKTNTNSQPRWYFFCRAGESLREDAKMGQLTLRTGFIWSTSTGFPQSIGMYERCTIGRSSCCKSWPSGSARWPSWTGSPWAPQSSLDSTQSSRWRQRGRFGRCRRWLFMEFVTILLFFFFKKVTIGSVPDVGCHYHLNKKGSTGRWISLRQILAFI